MGLFAGLVLLGISPVFFWGLNRYSGRFGISWVLALVIAGGFWGFTLLQFWQEPFRVSWPEWGLPLFGEFAPQWLLVDHITLPIGFATASVGLALLLTLLLREESRKWGNLAGILMFIGLASFGVFAASLQAIAFAWTALDVLEFWTAHRETPLGIKKRLYLLFFRLLATLFLLIPIGRNGGVLVLENGFSPGAGIWLLLSVWMRLGIALFRPEQGSGEERGDMILGLVRLAPVGGAAAIAIQVGNAGLPEVLILPALMAAVLLTVSAAIAFWGADGPIQRIHFWTVGVGSLVMAASVRGLWEASLAWAVILVIGAGLIYTFQHLADGRRWMVPIAGAAMSGLPFFPSWPATLLFTWENVVLDVILLAAAAAFVAGFARLGSLEPAGQEGLSSGERLIYLSGALFLFAVLLFLGWSPLLNGTPLAGSWLPAGILPLLAAVLWYGLRVEYAAIKFVLSLQRYFSAQWIHSAARKGFDMLGTFAKLVSRALEGDAAVLWALLLLGFILFAFFGAGG